MRHRAAWGVLAVLCAVLALGVGAAAGPCDADFGVIMDPPQKEYVSTGANAGQLKKLSKLFVHMGGDWDLYPSNFSWQFTSGRYRKLDGTPVNDNALAGGSGGSERIRCASLQVDATGCNVHQLNALVPPGEFTEWEWDAKLAGAGAEPGLYFLTIICKHNNINDGRIVTTTFYRAWLPENGVHEDNKGHIAFHFEDTGGQPVPGVTVAVNNGAGYSLSNVNGAVGFYNLVPQQYTFEVSGPTGYTGGGPYNVTVTAGQITTVNVRLYTDGTPPEKMSETQAPVDGGGEEPPPGGGMEFPTLTWWQDLFKGLFQPSPGTWASWDATRARLANWGPWGVVHGIATIFLNSADGGNEEQPVYQTHVPIWGQHQPGSPAAWTIDLRPLDEVAGTGSVFGNWFSHFRAVAGWAVYVVYCWLVIGWLRPRMAV